MRRTGMVVLSVACLLAPLHAHGGQYKGPNDGGGGTTSTGGNGTPPTSPGGGPRVGPGTPTSTPGIGPNTTGKGGRDEQGGTRAITGVGDEGTAWESWEFWWEANKDSFLDLKHRLAGAAGPTSGVSVLTGQGRHDRGTDSRRPSYDEIHGQVTPMLQDLLESSNDRDILDSAIVALARTGDESTRSDVVGLATGLLAHKEASVQSAAVLALGMAGQPEAVPVLHSLMTGSAEGRRLTGGGAVPTLARAFATLSLGLLDDVASIPRLIDLADNTKDSERDVKVAAIVALGLMSETDGGPAARWLLEKLQDTKLDSIIASYVPISLGRLGCTEAVSPLLAVFTSRDTDTLVRQSAVLGLGQLASLGQERVIAALTDYIREGRDQQTRHFCFISLAQIAARDGADDAQAGTRRSLVKLFGDELRNPSSAGHGSWAALAAAILGRADPEAAVALQPRLADAWEREKDPAFKSAFALALGLLDAKAMAEPLFADFQASRDPDHRGYTALALGFLGYREAADALRTQCAARSQVPTYRLQLATALGLMGDVKAVQTLITVLQGSETLGVSSAVARALGLIGDGAAIEPLAALAQDEAKPAITRAFACVALGRLCESSDLPWNARLAANNNYRARVPSMDEVLDIQ